MRLDDLRQSSISTNSLTKKFDDKFALIRANSMTKISLTKKTFI
jgi:hypothetical protein